MTLKTGPRGYDFHCHIDLYDNPQNVAARCAHNRVKVLAVTTTPKAFAQNNKWSSENDYMLTSCGLHPELVGIRYDEIGLLEELMEASSLIGEVGLDGSPKYSDHWDKQKDVFTRVLRKAQTLGERVISIHSRRAAQDVVAHVCELTSQDRVLCILHWYSGSKSIASAALSHGCYFSVNHQMLNSKAGREIVKSIPLERLLTETDGPFTNNGKDLSSPVDVLSIPSKIAAVQGLTESTVNEILKLNSERVLKFAHAC